VNEAGFWTKVRGAINDTPHARAHKLTDMFTAGTPDALYCIDGVTGVLELKYVPAWPVRDATLIEVGLTEAQRVWLEEWRGRAGGRAHVLLGVAKDWFLLELHEVPPAPAEGKLPRISRIALDAIRRQGRGATFKDLAGLLPATLAQQASPVVD